MIIRLKRLVVRAMHKAIEARSEARAIQAAVAALESRVRYLEAAPQRPMFVESEQAA